VRTCGERTCAGREERARLDGQIEGNYDLKDERRYSASSPALQEFAYFSCCEEAYRKGVNFTSRRRDFGDGLLCN